MKPSERKLCYGTTTITLELVAGLVCGPPGDHTARPGQTAKECLSAETGHSKRVEQVTKEQQDLFNRRLEEHGRMVEGYLEIWNQWRARLLRMGGCEVVPPLLPDPTIFDLLLSARTHGNKYTKRVPGETSRCHENVAELLYAGKTPDGLPITETETGYALSEDGLWRQHSWAIALHDTVVETTEPRLLYVGVTWHGRTNEETDDSANR